MKPRKVYCAIAQTLQARKACERSGNVEWHDKHNEALETLVMRFMPSGGGFDNGTTLDEDRSTTERLVFVTSYHHMSEHGFYDGWTEHTVIVRASLVYGFTVSVTGRNRDEIKDYIAESFRSALNEPEFCPTCGKDRWCHCTSAPSVEASA